MICKCKNVCVNTKRDQRPVSIEIPGLSCVRSVCTVYISAVQVDYSTPNDLGIPRRVPLGHFMLSAPSLERQWNPQLRPRSHSEAKAEPELQAGAARGVVIQ